MNKGTPAVEEEIKTKQVKQIKIDIDKCIGCRACELACAAFHATPKYSCINPAKARIRVMVDEFKNAYVPVRSGDYTPSECSGRYVYTIQGKEYRECSFCKAACPSRDYFKDPESGLPLECDMCESDPPLEEPWCVKACACDALTYEQRESAATGKQARRDEVETGLAALTNKYGVKAVMDILARMSKKG